MPIETRFGSYPDALAKFVRPTKQLDFDVAVVRKKANDLVRDAKTPLQAISSLWFFTSSLPPASLADTKKASEILKIAKADSNSRAILFIALLRQARIPTRPRAWRVQKKRSSLPDDTIASGKSLFLFPEVYYRNEWKLLSEILTKKDVPNWDRCPFLDANNRKFPLQNEWIVEDLGSSWHTDSAVQKFAPSGWKKLLAPFS